MSDEPANDHRRFQFRLSFFLCSIGLVAAGIAGFRFDYNALLASDPPLLYQLYLVVLYLTGPITAAIVLLLSPNAVAYPMSAGFLLAAAIEFYFGVTIGFGNPVMLSIGFLLGAIFGLVRLLWQEITPTRLLLGLPACFSLGSWLVALVL